MRTILIALLMTLATQVGAEDINLICDTTSETTTVFAQDRSIISDDETIVKINPSLTIGSNTLKADFLLFDVFECDKLFVRYTDENIKASCVGTTDIHGEKFASMSKSVSVSRYTSKVTATITNFNTNGTLFLYNYQGICKKSKKLF